MAAIQAIRGMKDILPDHTPIWQQLERWIQETVSAYGYEEIRMPCVESTELFKRSIGEITDIVEKEMYTFTDRNGDSLTLRPEGTAQCVRAAIENSLLYNKSPRLWYYGPMFRHERPQKGRYRQFYQLGVEAFGISTPDIDAEQIVLMNRLLQKCGIQDKGTLQINSLGTAGSRKQYRQRLVGYLTERKNQLDDDSLRRLETNPLRILDSKNPQLVDLIHHAPKLIDHIDKFAREHFETFKGLLDDAEVAYEINPYLVRGLDYYCMTVYEWVTDLLGAQGTVCAGGRYDGLVELIGAKPTPAVGFALGIERLITLIQQSKDVSRITVDAYLVLLGEKAQQQGLKIAEKIRNIMPNLRLLMNCGAKGPKGQFKKADKSGAPVCLIVGEDELAQNQISIKFLRENKPQTQVSIEELKAIIS